MQMQMQVPASCRRYTASLQSALREAYKHTSLAHQQHPLSPAIGITQAACPRREISPGSHRGTLDYLARTFRLLDWAFGLPETLQYSLIMATPDDHKPSFPEVVYQNAKDWLTQQQAFEKENKAAAPLTDVQRAFLEGFRPRPPIPDIGRKNYVGLLNGQYPLI